MANWIPYKLGELGNYINGRAFKPTEWETEGLPIIRIQNLNNSQAKYNYSSESYEDKYLVNNGDLLVAWSASLGVFIWDGGKAWLNQHIFKVEPNEKFIIKKFLYYAILNILAEIYTQTHGSGMVHITKPVFESQVIYVPEIEVQKEIVILLDSVLADNKKVLNALKNSTNFINEFRQSVLSAAFSGRLTEKWRNARSVGKWKTNKLIDLLKEKPRNGYSPRSVNYVTPYKVLTLTATTSGRFIKECYKYADIEIEKDSYLWLKNGNILIQRSNSQEHVGKCAIYDQPDNLYVYPDLMMKIIADTDVVMIKYLYYALSSIETRLYYIGNATGTAGNMPKINQSIVSNTPIPLPSKSEQEEIVRQIDHLFMVSDQIETSILTVQNQLEKFTKSILKQTLGEKFMKASTKNTINILPHLHADFGHAFKSMVKEAKATDATLAKALGVTISTISNYKAGREKPDNSMAEKLSLVLNRSEEEVVSLLALPVKKIEVVKDAPLAARKIKE